MKGTSVSEHYFTKQPSSNDKLSQIQVNVRGREYLAQTASGVFSSHRLDLGTQVLLTQVPHPEPQVKTALDLGCGWGPITLALADACPQAKVWGVDINERSLQLTKDNATAAGFSNVEVAAPEQALPVLRTTGIDLLWSNPPIRIGKEALHELLLTWLTLLTPQGKAYLVVSKNLGADSLQAWLGGQGFLAQKLCSKKGYRILEVVKN